jgi:glycosyltransferase involved in cell wall biosynthesis
MRAAWMMSRFPRLTETFVLNEILAARELGLDVKIYPLHHEQARTVHAEAEAVMEHVTYTPLLSPAIVWSQLYWLVRAPLRYLKALGALVLGAWGSARYLIVGLALFPKIAHTARLMRDDGIEHIHCHFANHPTLGGFVIHRLTDIPYSFTVHAFDLFLDTHMLRQKVREAAFVVTISEFNRRTIAELSAPTDARKVSILHCGVDARYFAPVPKERDGGELRVLCVGRLAPWKGQTYLIEACRLLVERGLAVRCDLVGGAGDREALQQQIDAAGLRDRISLLGWKTRDEIAALLAQTDVLAVPSVQMPDGRREGLPVILMEAMASELAVVASDLSGIPELVEDGRTGLLVPPGDAAALADALERLAGSPELRHALGTAGREKVIKEFELYTNTAELIRRITGAEVTAHS